MLLEIMPTVQSHMPDRSLAVATATLVTATFCFHNSALFYFVLNETFDMLQQQEALYFGYTDLVSHFNRVPKCDITKIIFLEYFNFGLKF